MSNTKNHIIWSFFFTFIGFVILFTSVSYAVGDAYESITPGITVDQVMELIGSPNDIEKDFSKDQLNSISNILKGLDNKKSELFLLWKINEKLLYIVGFNKENKVEVKHRMLYMDR